MHPDCRCMRETFWILEFIIYDFNHLSGNHFLNNYFSPFIWNTFFIPDYFKHLDLFLGFFLCFIDLCILNVRIWLSYFCGLIVFFFFGLYSSKYLFSLFFPPKVHVCCDHLVLQVNFRIILSRIALDQDFFGPDNSLLWEAVPCTVECLVASLVSTH